MSVTIRDIDTKLFKESGTVVRPENMENTMFHGNSMVYGDLCFAGLPELYIT